MEPIGKEVVRTELKYQPAKLERIDYVATTYACPECKDSLEPTFVKDFVTKPLVPHSYVSSGLAAHVMAKSGMNPKVLQYIMGHGDISVTLDTYTHIKAEDAIAELERLDLLTEKEA